MLVLTHPTERSGGDYLRARNGRMAGIAVVLSFLICSSLWSFGFGTEPPTRPLGSDRQEDLLDTFPPRIMLTSPAHEESNVGLYAPIVIQFNESMNTSSVSYEFISGPDPGMTWTWESSGYANDTIRGTHTNAFYPSEHYVFNVTYAEDLAGNPLNPGPVPNPWNWTVEAETVIIQTIPADGETNVSLTQPIIVHFYGPLGPLPNITIEILPELGPRVEEWSMDMLIVRHMGFLPCTIYMVGVYLVGFPFPIPFPSLVPNPWHFTTTCHPVIIETDPPDGSINTPPDYPINVTFSRPMNTTSVNWTIDPHLDLTPSWSENDTLLTLSHIEQFNMLTLYTMEITQGRDKEGNDLVWGPVPNPWSFSTTCIQNYISFTDPSHEETDVSVNRSIIVGFMSCMEPSSLSWTIDPFIDLTPNWSNDSTLLEFTHVSGFEDCTEYTMEVYAEDEYGNPLLPGPVPNPWSFTTTGLPVITETNPSDGEFLVLPEQPINVTFSRPMNTSSVNWTIVPYIDLTPSWGQNDTFLTLSHSEYFITMTLYTVAITEAKDVEGHNLVPGPVPNPWSFSIMSCSPYIESTDPYHGEVNVSLDRSIVVQFSHIMNPSSLIWTIDPYIDLVPNWSNENRMLELSHSVDFDNGTEYTISIDAENKYGNPLLPGPVPNPWNWTTIAEPLPPPPPPAPPRNTTAYLSGPQLRDVTLSWLLSIDDFPGGNVSHYDIYRRADAYNGSGLGYSYLASVPKGVSAFVDQFAGQDTHSYYYFVCAVNVNGSTCASDQAGKFFRALDTGPQLVSIPIIPQDESIGTVLQTAQFDNVWYYDSSSQSWKWYMKGKSYEGELRTIDDTMGLWVNVTSSSNLVVAGSVPSSTSVTLRKGWNLVPFPSLDEGFTVSDLKAVVGATRVEGFSPTSPYLLRVLEDWVTLASGFGYWVKVEEDTMWTVSNQ